VQKRNSVTKTKDLKFYICSYFGIFIFNAVNSLSTYIEKTTVEETMNIPINEIAPVKSKNQIEIRSSIETVWKILTDIRNWPKWQKAVTKTIVDEDIEDIKEGTTFKWKANGILFKSKIHTSKPNAEFGWTGTTIGAKAIHNWTFLKKDDNTTIVIVEESLQGVFPTLFRQYFQNNLDKSVLTNLIELKEASETSIK